MCEHNFASTTRCVRLGCESGGRLCKRSAVEERERETDERWEVENSALQRSPNFFFNGSCILEYSRRRIFEFIENMSYMKK